MSEWKNCTISDLGNIIGGATPSTKNPAYYDGGEIPWITPKDLAGFQGRFISHGERNITEAGLRSCSAQMLPAHTILFSSRAPIGYIAIAANSVCTNQGFKSVIPNDNTDYLFLYYLMKYYKHVIEGMGSGTTFKEVSAATMREIKVRVPKEKRDQHRIAAFLSTLDDKIENNNQINKNLFQQLFVLFNNIYSSNGCSVTELGSLCTFQEGYVNPPQNHPEFFDGAIKWLRAVDINESFILSTSRTLTQVGFHSAKKSAYLFSPNTIAISKSGTIGRLGIISDFMCGNRAVINIAPNISKYLPFIYSYLKNRQEEFPNLAVGSVQKNLYISLLEPLKVQMPEAEILNQFCDIGNAILGAIKNNCFENLRLRNLRDTLLPRLMSGELDVSNLDL